MAVLGAASLARALDLLREEPDVVVADLGLPDSCGVEALRRLRDADRGVPVLVLTGTESAELRRDCHRLGAADYLVKPVRGSDLADRIRDVLRSAPG